MGSNLRFTVVPRGNHDLRELLSDSGTALPSDCGGVGTCGKCRVPLLDAEGERTVLACQYVPTAPVAVELDRSGPVGQVRRVGH